MKTNLGRMNFREHRVQQGESLTSISLRYFTDTEPTSLQAICDNDGKSMPAGTVLTPGMRLRIYVNNDRESLHPNRHLVGQGDSLSRLARQFYGDASKWRLIYQANQDRLADPNRLPVGTELRIPSVLTDMRKANR